MITMSESAPDGYQALNRVAFSQISVQFLPQPRQKSRQNTIFSPATYCYHFSNHKIPSRILTKKVYDLPLTENNLLFFLFSKK